jgi:hypothetical protein
VARVKSEVRGMPYLTRENSMKSEVKIRRATNAYVIEHVAQTVPVERVWSLHAN